MSQFFLLGYFIHIQSEGSKNNKRGRYVQPKIFKVT